MKLLKSLLIALTCTAAHADVSSTRYESGTLCNGNVSYTVDQQLYGTGTVFDVYSHLQYISVNFSPALALDYEVHTLASENESIAEISLTENTLPPATSYSYGFFDADAITHHDFAAFASNPSEDTCEVKAYIRISVIGDTTSQCSGDVSRVFRLYHGFEC